MTSTRNAVADAAPATDCADHVSTSKPSRKRLRVASEAHEKPATSSASSKSRKKEGDTATAEAPAASDASDAAPEQPRQTKASVVEALLTREGGTSLKALGGPVPLGYQVIERKLFPLSEEAERVREIMRRYIASTSANQLIAELEAEGIRTKVQHRTSGPHKGGIPFRRGSLFHLLANPIYRGMIAHKGKVYDGEHEAIVDEELWDAVQARLQQKAPPRKRKSNEPQEAMLRGLLTDPEGRPMVPTYTKKGTRRYAYYETRKDLAAKPDATPPTRIAQSSIERHIVTHLTTLLEDEHALRRLTGLQDAGQLTALFDAARLRHLELAHPSTRDETVRSLIVDIAIGPGNMRVTISLAALGSTGETPIELPLPERRPFREAKLWIDSAAATDQIDRKLVSMIAEAMEVRELVLASPELSLNQLGKREGRCRTQLGKLFRLSWLSPRIIEAIIDGRQPARINRRALLEADLPTCWQAQERMLGFAT